MKKINKILVATDFSSNGARAINYAANLSAAFKAQLIILHVEDDTQKRYLKGLQKYESYDEFVKTKFESIYAGYLAYKRVQHVNIFKKGVIHEQVINTCKSENVDLAVVGISGLNKGFELEFGSVTLKLLNLINVPLVVVPESFQYLKLHHIIIASDQLAPKNGTDLSIIDQFIQRYDSNVHLTSIGTSGMVFSENYRKLQDKTAAFIDKEFISEEPGHIISHLNAEIKALQADLLVVFRRKKSVMGNHFMPRLSNLIAINTQIPILFIPTEMKLKADEDQLASESES